MRFRDRLVAAWYAPRTTALAALLLPLAGLFGLVVAARRALFAAGVLRSERLPVAVVVVGNLTVGGTGKTPLTLALAQSLAVRGLRPGIVSRGYGGARAARRDPPLLVSADDDPVEVGDEPLLLASAGFPTAIGRDRAAAGRLLLAAHPELDVVLSDDGLQHYGLARDCEIVVVDGRQGFGNGHLLPAGPLREPIGRLKDATAVVVTGTDEPLGVALPPLPGGPPVYVQQLVPAAVVHCVGDPSITKSVSELAGRRVHAVAGIGHPGRYFATLARLGIDAEPHPFPDHHRFVPGDLAFAGDAPVVMTAKDAVKCRAFADARCWYLPVRADVDPALADRVERTIRGPEAP